MKEVELPEIDSEKLKKEVDELLILLYLKTE